MIDAIALCAAGLAGSASPAAPTVACAVEPALAVETTLALHAWAVDAAGAAVGLPAGLHWQVDRGEAEARPVDSARPVRWTIPDKPRSGLMRAQLVHADGRVVCTATSRRVPGTRGMEPPKGAARARHFLTRDREEPRGYAALAYLLLPAPPAPPERERILRLLAAWLRQLPPTAEMEQYVERDQLTLFLLPLRDVPALKADAAADPRAERAVAQSLLAAYDHARAQAMMARMGLEAAGPGPLLATRQVVPGAETGAQMVEDLSAVDPSLAEAWMRWSLSLVSQPRERSAEALQRVAMTLRNAIAHAARGLPDVGAASRDRIRVSAAPSR
ncbi:MAG: hypothetical protein HYZ20_17215 [Burkholderiales bacterium]|nr:hypothetical protein [Burkholderiales bacterium]